MVIDTMANLIFNQRGLLSDHSATVLIDGLAMGLMRLSGSRWAIKLKGGRRDDGRERERKKDRERERERERETERENSL